jgi:hypothetical protein
VSALLVGAASLAGCAAGTNEGAISSKIVPAGCLTGPAAVKAPSDNDGTATGRIGQQYGSAACDRWVIDFTFTRPRWFRGPVPLSMSWFNGGNIGQADSPNAHLLGTVWGPDGSGNWTVLADFDDVGQWNPSVAGYCDFDTSRRSLNIPQAGSMQRLAVSNSANGQKYPVAAGTL